MRDPTWKTDHPVVGQSGVEYVWRFGDVGFVARTKVGGGGWEGSPVRFLGPEINNYVPNGDMKTGMTPAEVEVILTSFEVVANEAPAVVAEDEAKE